MKLALVVGLTACGSGAEATPDYVAPPPSPGYPIGATRLRLRLTLNYVQYCQGTLVHPNWVLTAAHCFSGVPLGAIGVLEEYTRFFSREDVVIYPEALRFGADVGGFDEESIVAAHDLALVPLSPGVEIDIPALWRPADPDSILPELAMQEVQFAHTEGMAYTAFAQVAGMVLASDLLSEDQQGELLGLRGTTPHSGDSGAGLLMARLPKADDPAGPGDDNEAALALIAVVQNAPAEGDGLFGAVPIFSSQHRAWIEQTLRLDVEPVPCPGAEVDGLSYTGCCLSNERCGVLEIGFCRPPESLSSEVLQKAVEAQLEQQPKPERCDPDT